MLSSLLITLREGLEAALLIGLLFSVVSRTGVPSAGRRIWLGIAAATLVSLAAGAALFATGASLEGSAEELFEAGAMLLAAGVLAWVILWMGTNGRSFADDLGGRVATAAGSAALFWLAFLLVVREGLEMALFLFAAIGGDGDAVALAGALTGLLAAAGVGYLVYRGGARLNLRTLFRVLNALLLAFGVYLVWRGAGELGELLAGGEAGELAGPVAAVAYGVVLGVSLRRGRRLRDDGRAVTGNRPGATPQPGGVTGRPRRD